MSFTVGGVDVTAVHVGATPAVAVYAGSEKVWPGASAPHIVGRYTAGAITNATPGPGQISVNHKVIFVNEVDLDGHTIDLTAVQAGWHLRMDPFDYGQPFVLRTPVSLTAGVWRYAPVDFNNSLWGSALLGNTYIWTWSRM